MPLESELNLSESELQGCDRRTRTRITERFARLKGLQFLQTQNWINRDSQRHDAQARAVRRAQGIDMPDDPDDENVLGDKTVNEYLPWATVALLGTLGLGTFGVIGLKALQSPSVTKPEIEAPEIPGDTRNEPIVSGGGRG